MAVFILKHVLAVGTIHYWLDGRRTPWGTEIVVDALNAYVLVILLFLGLLSVMYSKRSMEREVPQKIVPFYTIFQLLMTGLCGVTVTGDIFNIVFNMYWFIEIISLSAYALIALRGWIALKASCVYLIAWLIGSYILLSGIRFLYAVTGSYNMHDLSLLLPPLYENRVVQMAFVFFIVGLSVKMTFFPLYTGLVDAYAFGPSKISAMLSGIIILVSTYLFMRLIFSVFTLNFLTVISMGTIISGIAAITIIFGSILAIAGYIMRREASFEEKERKETALPVIGGALNIVCGVFGLIGGYILLIMGSMFFQFMLPLPMPTELGGNILIVSGIVALILGAIAIYGGICATRRVKFGWAIGGGICASLSFSILGVAGLILIIVARAEFK
ncbi:MAG: proton-conducting transporter membrane subunit [Methanophagales archaeon]|nr:proton-conducting transporter membrane subunit [Methanophagales archaeon]